MKKLMLVLFVAALLAAIRVWTEQARQSGAGVGFAGQSECEFQIVQTDFVWDQYQKVVDEHDIQRGVMYFKRSGQPWMWLPTFCNPSPDKKLLFKNGEVQVYVTQDRPDDHYMRARTGKSSRVPWRLASVEAAATSRRTSKFATLERRRWRASRPTNSN